jgi:hypothetical protein
MANPDCPTFEDFAEYWMFCTPALLLYRYERCVAIARTNEDRKIVAAMLDRYLEEVRMRRGQQLVEKDTAGVKETDLVLQRGTAGRYAGPTRHDRFQVMESLTPVGTYYVVDHSISDLLLRENGPASNVRRFPTRKAAEEETDRLAERPAEITAAARRRGGLDVPPSPGRGRGVIAQETEMAKPKKAEAPPKGAAKTAPPTPAKKNAAPAAKAAAPPTPAANGAGTRGRKSAATGKKITLVVKENPCRVGTMHHKAYALYKTGDTVEAFLAKGGRMSDVNYDVAKGHISLS